MVQHVAGKVGGVACAWGSGLVTEVMMAPGPDPVRQLQDHQARGQIQGEGSADRTRFDETGQLRQISHHRSGGAASASWLLDIMYIIGARSSPAPRPRSLPFKERPHRRALSSQTPTSRCRSAAADRQARARESPPGAGHAATGTRVALRPRPRLRTRQHVRP